MSDGQTSMERAIQELKIAESAIGRAVEELGQLDRCSHSDYPSGAPPLKRCVLKEGHGPPHRYPGLHFMDGGKAYHDMTVEEQLAYHRGEANHG